MRTRRRLSLAFLACVVTMPAATASAQNAPACDPDNGGLTLPQGFCALVVADIGARVRHIVVRPNGDIFVAVIGRGGRGEAPTGGGVLALRDTTGNGKIDVRERFGPDRGGTGIEISGDVLYFAPDDAVLRYRVPAGRLTPAAEPDTLVSGLPFDRSHAAKTIALSGDRLFVNIGSPSNVCQQPGQRGAGAAQDPCPELQNRAGIWLFDPNRTRQRQSDGARYATGIRNAVAIAINPADDGLYVVQHGRDALFQSYPQYFSQRDGAEKPAEEFMKVDRGDDFGWPYCFYDPEKREKVLAPEYGGDGEQTGRCADKEKPLYGYPGHWAPNDLLFYTGTQFPEHYRNGAFIAFHGSWNRNPEPQDGYNVVFQPMANGTAIAGEFQVFADGFAGPDKNNAQRRPTGLAQGPDGSLYITDDSTGRIWRVLYRAGR